MTDPSAMKTGLRPQLDHVATNASSPSHMSIRRLDSGLNHFAELVQSISNQDIEARYKVEEGDNRVPTDDTPDPSQFQGSEGRTVISWEVNDKENPYNWSLVSIFPLELCSILATLTPFIGAEDLHCYIVNGHCCQ